MGRLTDSVTSCILPWRTSRLARYFCYRAFQTASITAYTVQPASLTCIESLPQTTRSTLKQIWLSITRTSSRVQWFGNTTGVASVLQDIQVWQPSITPEANGDGSFQITTLEGGRRRVYHSSFNDVAETIAQKLQVCQPFLLLLVNT